MPLLSADDPLPGCPRRVAVAGTSGSGKTTLARRVGTVLEVPHVEIDALFHGPGWTTRPRFEADVRRLAARPAWVTEWQYGRARPLLAARAELLVWLDLRRWRVMTRVSRRTLVRSVRRQVLWNGNVEPPLWTLLTRRGHIVRWAWATHAATAERVAVLVAERPDLPVVRLPTPRAAARWVDGPLRAAVGSRGASG